MRVHRNRTAAQRPSAQLQPASAAVSDSPRQQLQAQRLHQLRATAPLQAAAADAAGVVQRIGNRAYDALVDEDLASESSDVEAHGDEWDMEDGMESMHGSEEHDTQHSTYLDAVEDGLERSVPLAFVINAILSVHEVEDLPEVVNAMRSDLDEDIWLERVAIVLGINAPEDQGDALDKAMTRALQLAHTLPVPIALVRSTWKGSSFPYGEMRNAVLHSEETRSICRAFVGQEYHPYVSVQDFDTGSRRVPGQNVLSQGPHVFNEVEERLEGHARPLMVGGGYRPSPDLVARALKRLESQYAKLREQARDEDTLQGLAESEAKIAAKLKEPGFLARFSKHVQHDMASRQDLASVHPLLPYTPEPNLFMDGIALTFAEEDLDAKPPSFGKGAAEYSMLAKTLSALEMAEMLHGYAQSDPRSNSDIRIGEIHERLSADLQSGRHPQRGQNYLVDYPGLAIETDLSRLALAYLSTGKDPQSHIGQGQVMDRFFDSKDAKNKTSMSQFLGTLKRHKSDGPILSGLEGEDPIHEQAQRLHGALRALSDPSSKLSRSAFMPTRAYNQMSSAISTPFPKGGPFEDLSTGIQPSQKGMVFGITAMGPQLATTRFSLLLRTLLARLGDGTPLDGNCLYHAVHQARSGGVVSNDAAALLRQQAVAWALDDTNLPVVAEYAFTHSVSLDALVDTLSRNGAWGGPAGDLAPRILASALGITLVIRLADSGAAVEVPPLVGDGGEQVVITLSGQHYSVPRANDIVMEDSQ